MTEILVQSLEEEGGVVQPGQPNLQLTSSIQMQGFAAASSETSPQGRASAYSKEKRDRASSRGSGPASSLRSEPDLDAIMPLPRSSFYARGAGGGGGYQEVRGEGSDSEEERDGDPYSPTIASFTTVEVRRMSTGTTGGQLASLLNRP